MPQCARQHPRCEAGEHMAAYKARLVATHIQTLLAQSHYLLGQQEAPAANLATTVPKPLVVGVQGPQGSGKTTLTRRVVEALAASGGSGGQRPLNVTVFSVDDFYLPFDGLERVARENSGNGLLQGRGQPGTHDVQLCSDILSSLETINSGTSSTVELPVFDKSQNGGRGDRLSKTVIVTAPLDLVLFEGWCLGFQSLSPGDLQRRYREATRDAAAGQCSSLTFAKHSLAHLEAINEHLRRIEEAWYPYIHAFVQLVPTAAASQPSSRGDGAAKPATALRTVFDWRLEAEHAMKAHNGGKGMTDEEVYAFVERYMPGYELFGEGVIAASAPWAGKVLRIGLGTDREVTAVDYC